MNTDLTVLLEINWDLILPFALPIIVLNLLLIGTALYDWSRRRQLITTPYVWLFVIIMLQSLGPILYLVIGRRMLRNDYH
jgi:hypothetical protein